MSCSDFATVEDGATRVGSSLGSASSWAEPCLSPSCPVKPLASSRARCSSPTYSPRQLADTTLEHRDDYQEGVQELQTG